MNNRLGRIIKSPSASFFPLRMVFAFGLLAVLPGCSLVVMQAAYEEDKEQSQKAIDSVRGQLLAHTQILANHGKSLNEFKLQLRDTVSNVEKAVKELKTTPQMKMKSPKPGRDGKTTAKPAEPALKSGRQNRTLADTRYIRRTYRGLALSYAGGYNEPRGSRYPYRLKPGTRVAIISGDRRGFTRVEVRSGRWVGKKMWVRTRWLVEKAPNRSGGKG